MTPPFDEPALINAFGQAAELASVAIAPADIRVEACAAPHAKPKPFAANEQAIYVFFLGELCVKVGKAGPRNSPRFCHHHYDVKMPSTLAKSILAKHLLLAEKVPQHATELSALDAISVGPWIMKNCCRINIYIPCAPGPLALNFLEAFVQCRLRPFFEG
jgi:hypothetical protein